MEHAKKRGRPKRSEPTVAIGYRLPITEFKALEAHAKQSDSKIAVETVRAVREYLRKLGVIPEKK